MTLTQIVGRLDLADGTPDPGTVLLEPICAHIDLATPALVTTGPVFTKTAADGTFTLTVEASDSPDWAQPTPVYYWLRVRTQSGFRGDWTVLIPEHTGPVDWTTLVPVNAPPGVAVVVGPQGVTGPQGPVGPQGPQGLPGGPVPPSTATDDGSLLTVNPAGVPVWEHALVDDVAATIHRTDSLQTDVNNLKANNGGRRVTHPNGTDVLVEEWDAGKGRWQRTHYDSGWRDIAGLLETPTNWEAVNVQARRVGSFVEVLGYLRVSPQSTAIGTRNLKVWPTAAWGPGWKLWGTMFGEYGLYLSAGINYLCAVAGTGYIIQVSTPVDVVAGAVLRLRLRYPVNEDVTPTSLIGTLASAAPN